MHFRLLSILVALFLTVALRAEQVVISEIMYQPPAGKPEFIELWNITVTPLDTARWRFTDGMDYAFPDFDAASPQAHLLKPFERIIISAATEAQTRAAYPSIPPSVRILGPWGTSSLANEGELVTLKDKNGVIVCAVEYGDSGEWPIAPDGTGHSLVLTNENKTINDWRIWRASTNNGGSPGQAEPAPFATGITLNEAHFNATGRVDWIEVRNDSRTTSQVADGLFVASKNDFTDKVALAGNIAPGALASVNVNFPVNGDGEVKLYIVDSNNHARDAIKLTRKPGRDAWQRFPAESREWFNGTTDTRDAQNDPARNTDIVINEIMADPPSNQRDGEFIELYNRGAVPVDVGGWKLKEGVNFTIPPGTMIQPGSYLVIGANASWLNANYPGLNAIGNWDGQLANGGEVVKLDDANDNLVNSVDYRFGGEWPVLANGDGSSLELVNPNTDNAVGSAWADSDESQKSTFQSFSINGGTYRRGDGTTGAPSPVDDEIRIWSPADTHIILKDIVLRPTAGGANILVNPNVTTLNNNNVDGWQSRGTHFGCFDDAEGVHLVADGHGDNKANHMEKDTAGMQGGVGYTLEFQARWVWGKPRLVTQTWDLSWGGTTLVPIPSNLGTPGAANSRFHADPAVQITAMKHSPAVPTTGQMVTVTARISSQTPVQTVQVIHRLDNINANGTWNTTTMADSGASGDAVANDGVYSAQINPASFGYGSSTAVVEFYIRATASNGRISELPRSGAAAPGLWAVGTSGTSDLRRIRVVMSNYWLDALSQDSGTGGHTAKFNFKYPRLSARYFPCVFIHNDSEIYYNARCRKTGSPFTRETHNGLERGRISLPGDNLFRGKTRMYWDDDGTSGGPAGALYHNRIVRYWLYLLGVPGNENEYCRIARNGGTYIIRETSEVFDKDMLDRIWENGSAGSFFEVDDKFWIGDDGSFRAGNQDGSWAYKSSDSQGAENPTAYHNNFVPKSREWEYDYSGLIEWNKQLATRGPSLTLEELERMADTQTMAAYAAVRGYVADWDTLTGRRGKNCYMYQRATDGKWTMLHWDSDLAFQTATDPVLGSLTNVQTYYQRPFVWRYLNYYLTELLTKYSANGPRMTAWLDAEEDSSTFFSSNKSTYQTWSTNRAATVQSFIGSPFSGVNFVVTSPVTGGTTANNTVNLTGTAPSRAFRIECESQPNLTFAWTNQSTWTLSGVVLAPGTNTLVLRMLDMFGNPVDNPLNFVITKTGDAPPVAKFVSDPAFGNANVGEIVTVDASGSFDPGGGPVTVSWTVTPSTGVTISSPSPTLRRLIFSTPGSYSVTAQVTDNASQSTSFTRTFTVYSGQDFDSFGGDYLSGLTVTNSELRDNYSAASWYSLNETTGHLVVQVLDSAPRPLTHVSPAFPLFTKPVPATDNFILQTDLTLENKRFGTFFTGLWLETVENGTTVRYAFGFENGFTFKMFRASGANAFQVQAGSGTYAGGPVTLRVSRQGQSLQFQRSINGVWTTISTWPLPAGTTAMNGGIFVAAGSTSPVLPQTIRVAFDYLLLANPGNGSDLVRDLRVTEIMYNPGGSGVEFIELQNIGTAPLDLTGAYFEENNPWSAQFTFPALVLDPGEFCVVTNNTAGFQTRYGMDIVVAGEALGGLANDSERLVLRDADGNLVFDFTYSDSWYSSTDGNGRSLDLAGAVDPTNYGAASTWRPSYANGGSAGYVDVAPAITSQPTGTTINPSQPFQLEGAASGVPAPTLRWHKDGQPIPGATSAIYSVGSATEDHDGEYELVATNGAGVATSAKVIVSVNDPVSFTAHPEPKAVNPGAMVTFDVEPAGTGPFTYQWRRNEQPLEGETGATLTFQAAENLEGAYDVVVTNMVNSATSNAAALSVNNPVMITSHPQDKTVNPDDGVEFTVTVTGTGPFTYQWFKDSEPIEGQTSAVLAIEAAEEDEGAYNVVVTNAVGSVPSNPATLSVNDPVEITNPPQGLTVNPGSPFTLSVTATGTAPLSYQWRKGTVPIENATGSSYTDDGAAPGDAGSYDVVVTNPVGPVTSATATVVVTGPPVITRQPAPQVLRPGGTATFTVQVSGTAPFTYQWRKGGTPIDNATGATLTIPQVTADHAGSYDVVVTNVAGPVESEAASLSFIDLVAAAGTYQGLLKSPNFTSPTHDPLPGRITVVLAKTGRFTGTFEFLGLKHGFKGEFDLSLRATPVVARRGLLSIPVNLLLDGTSNTIQIATAPQGFPSTYESEAQKIPLHSRAVPSPLTGRYTLLVTPGTGAPADLSAPGFATLSVGVNGSASWTGKLPDGATLRGTAWLAGDNSAAFYSPLYVARVPYAGHLAGPVAFTSADIAGDLAWNKPAQARGVFWPAGFKMLAEVAGARFTAPAPGAKIVPMETAQLAVQALAPAPALNWPVTFTLKNTFLFAPPNVEKARLAVSRTTGAVTGSYRDGRFTRKLQGVLIQGENRAAGFFQNATRAGTWTLEATP